jgi:hypothetical protein
MAAAEATPLAQLSRHLRTAIRSPVIRMQDAVIKDASQFFHAAS